MADNVPQELITPGGTCIVYKGRALYSRYAPDKAPRRIAASASILPKSLFIIPSPLLFYGVQELLERLDAESSILCLEHDPLLMEVALKHMPSGISAHPRFTLCFVESVEDCLRAALRMGAFRRRVLLRLPGFLPDEAFFKECEKALSSDLSRFWRNKATILSMGRLWHKNLIANLALLPSAAEIPKPKKGQSLLVAGAGESLESTIDLIKRKRADLFVIAADTSVGCLIESGVKPDLIVCLESQIHNLSDFLSVIGSGIALACDITAHAPTLRALDLPVSFFASEFAESRLLKRLEAAEILPRLLPALGSVGVTACALAIELSRAPIFLCGLDFSYRMGKTHARGSPRLKDELNHCMRLSEPTQIALAFRPGVNSIKDKKGAWLFTDSTLSGYASLIEGVLEGRAASYDIGSQGLDLGIANIRLSEAATIIDEWAKSEAPQNDDRVDLLDRGDHVDPNDNNREELARRIAAFRDEEVERCGRIFSILKGKEPLDRDAFLALIMESDYLYMHFPDAERVTELDQSFLNRLLIEAGNFRERWERLEIPTPRRS